MNAVAVTNTHPSGAAAPRLPLSPALPPSVCTREVKPIYPGLGDEALREAYADCARTVRHRARNFYHGLRLTPEPRRSAIYSIYAWMRAADDLADAPLSAADRRRSLAFFRAATEHVLAREAPPRDAEPLWLAFGATCASYPIAPGIFSDLLDGLDEDLDSVAYRDDAQLSRYCYRVAGTAGLACLWIWGLRNPADLARAQDLALRRGQAFQRTNILRDFAEDFDTDPPRIYIPSDALARHRVSAEDLRHWKRPEACAALVIEQARITREHYVASAGLESLIDADCSATLWAMTRIYSGLLDLIEREPSRIAGDKRIRLAGATKASIALGAALWAKVGRW